MARAWRHFHKTHEATLLAPRISLAPPPTQILSWQALLRSTTCSCITSAAVSASSMLSLTTPLRLLGRAKGLPLLPAFPPTSFACRQFAKGTSAILQDWPTSRGVTMSWLMICLDFGSFLMMSCSPTLNHVVLRARLGSHAIEARDALISDICITAQAATIRSHCSME